MSNTNPVRSPIHQRFDQLLDRMHRTFASKDRAYAGEVPLANIRRSERVGIPPSVACFIRMTDKFSRMESLIRNANDASVGAGDEGILDNAFDLAVYALIFTILKDEETGLNTEAIIESIRTDASRDLWKGSMVASVEAETEARRAGRIFPGQILSPDVSDSRSPGSAAIPIPPTHPSKSSPTQSQSSPGPNQTGTGTSSAPALSLAADLYMWYIQQFRFADPLPFSLLDPVTQSAWIETAKKVLDRYGIK